MTHLKIALLDARADGAHRLAERLSRSLAESGTVGHVVALDGAAPDLNISSFDSFFLRGLSRLATADLSLQAADDALRAALRETKIAYQVIYGNDNEALKQMRRALEDRITAQPTTSALSNQEPSGRNGTTPWVWLCDKCSDPHCEHRLLTDLLERRQTRI